MSRQTPRESPLFLGQRLFEDGGCAVSEIVAITLGTVVSYVAIAIARLWAMALALRGTRPAQRAEIIRAVGECFRGWPRRFP